MIILGNVTDKTKGPITVLSLDTIGLRAID